MIVHNSHESSGLKFGDISPKIFDIPNNAKQVVVICGYAFMPYDKKKSVLKRVVASPAPVKHCILPLDLYGGSGYNKNKSTAIELVKQGVSVSIEGLNHSKWLMSESMLYFGSANFTEASLERRIEVVTFRSFQPGDALRKEFSDFVVASMRQVKATSYRKNRKKMHGVIQKNDALIAANIGAIKRLNPNIEKVKTTLEAVADVRSSLHLLMENLFWLLGKDAHYTFWKQLSLLVRRLGAIEYWGNRLIESEVVREHETARYNINCDAFNEDYKLLSPSIERLLKISQEEQDYTVANRMLIQRNLPSVQALLQNQAAL